MICRGAPHFLRSMPKSKKDYEGIEPCAVGSTVEVLINPHHAARPELLEVSECDDYYIIRLREFRLTDRCWVGRSRNLLFSCKLSPNRGFYRDTSARQIVTSHDFLIKSYQVAKFNFARTSTTR